MAPDLRSIIRRLEQGGYRLTGSRAAVVAAVLNQKGHFTVDAVMRQCPRIGRATVFRTVKLLTEIGVVCRVLLEDGSLHYRLSPRGHHHHLVCVACGRVQDLDECVVSDLVGELARISNYEIEGHWLELYGRCLACRANERIPVPA